MAETVLVTGGTGFIARWCIVELVRRGYDVRTTVRIATREPSVRSAIATEIDARDRLECVVADLTLDDGWDAAVNGCDYVLHVASPLRTGDGGDPDALIIPARDGTLRVLRAATKAGAKRVVMTSAANAASPSSYTEQGVTDETLWTDLDTPHLPAYRRSKTLAEKAAWELMQDSAAATTLATVLPGAVFGPILATDNIGSVAVIGRMLSGAMPGTPRIGLEVVDVRDLVDLHLRAMTAPEAAGQRFLGTGEFMWMADIAKVLRASLGPEAAKVPKRVLPNVVVRMLARSRPELRGIMPGLGRKNRHSTAKAEQLLGWTRRPTSETIVDCARSLISHGAVR
jgi:nucleoside-diphosphate-sugar epimerase